MAKAFTFKQLVRLIHDIKTENERDVACYEINYSFESDKISFDDHEMLYDLACMVRISSDRCRYE